MAGLVEKILPTIAPGRSQPQQRKKYLSSPPVKNHHRSIFTEIGLNDAAIDSDNTRRSFSVSPNDTTASRRHVGGRLQNNSEAQIQSSTTSSVPLFERFSRCMMALTMLSPISSVAVLLAIILPIIQMSLFGQPAQVPLGADAGVVPPPLRANKLVSRQNSAVDICLRWGHQSAMVNGTIYLFGGRSKTDSNQDSDTWSKFFQPTTSMEYGGLMMFQTVIFYPSI